MQLMQPYVQKSSSTTLPFKAASDKGFSVFSQPRSPVNSGARIRERSCTGISKPFDEALTIVSINHRGHRESQTNGMLIRRCFRFPLCPLWFIFIFQVSDPV